MPRRGSSSPPPIDPVAAYEPVLREEFEALKARTINVYLPHTLPFYAIASAVDSFEQFAEKLRELIKNIESYPGRQVRSFKRLPVVEGSRCSCGFGKSIPVVEVVSSSSSVRTPFSGLCPLNYVAYVYICTIRVVVMASRKVRPPPGFVDLMPSDVDASILVPDPSAGVGREAWEELDECLGSVPVVYKFVASKFYNDDVSLATVTPRFF